MRYSEHMNRSQSGNVFLYILVAVALIGALTYAVSSGSRGSANQITEERAKLYAGEIIEYGNNLASAVSQVRLRGTDVSLMCFDHASWGANDYDHGGCTDDMNRIYHPSGGGITWVNAPAEGMDTAATPDNLFHFYGDNEIENVGTTTGAAGSADLILVVDELLLSTCQHINGLLGVTDSDDAPPTDSAFGETRYIGSFGYTETIGDEAGGAALAGKTAACFQKTDAPAEYVFYKVLVSR